MASVLNRYRRGHGFESLACVAGGGGYPRERECEKPLRSREEWGGVWLNFARGFAARKTSLAGEACEGISGTLGWAHVYYTTRFT